MYESLLRELQVPSTQVLLFFKFSHAMTGLWLRMLCALNEKGCGRGWLCFACQLLLAEFALSRLCVCVCVCVCLLSLCGRTCANSKQTN